MALQTICHFTCNHPAHDTRVGLKECSTLAEAGFDTYLVALSDNDKAMNGVKVRGIRKPKRILGRYLFDQLTAQQWLIFKRARQTRASVFHFHDPQLIFLGLLFKFLGKKVVYDIHEHTHAVVVQAKIPSTLKHLLRKICCGFEHWCMKRFDLNIVANRPIGQNYTGVRCNLVEVNNYPLLEEFSAAIAQSSSPQKNGVFKACFVGLITEPRGLIETLEALSLTGSCLELAGNFAPPEFESECRKHPAWNRVNFHGFVDRNGFLKIATHSNVGLVLYKPAPNHMNCEPNKLFEYMAFGLPVIASNFKGWADIIEGSKCGLCVDPLKPQEIAAAMNYLREHPAEAEQMGQNGRKAVLERYNWDTEGRKLVEAYHKLFQ